MNDWQQQIINDTPPPPDAIGKLRDEVGETCDLAKMLGVSLDAVASWICGRRTPSGSAIILMRRLVVGMGVDGE